MSETATAAPEGRIDYNKLIQILPHRFPFLLVDRIIESRPGFVVGQKCVTINEWFFQGHFPQQPVMPGVLILEAMAQTAAVLAHQYEENAGRLIFLMGINDAKFRRIVSPGDVLRIEATETYRRKGIGKCEAKVFVEGNLVCEAELTFAAQPKPKDPASE